VRSPRAAPAAAIAVIAAGLAFWVSFRLYTGIQLEDAFITYRYAANLAGGAGFVFNAGERVLGTTTPLYTLVLGAFGALLGPGRIPLVSSVLAILFAGGAAALTFSALGRLRCPEGARLFAIAAFCFHPEFAWMCTSGMETPLVLLLMAWGLQAAASRRWAWAAVASALLVLARIDGLAWAAAIFLLVLVEDRRSAAKGALLGALLLLPWILFAFAYFGSPIPHSVIAKRAIGRGAGIGGLLYARAFAAWVLPFLGAGTPFGWPAGVLLAAAAPFAAARRSAAWILAAFSWLFCALLYAGRAPLYFDWYLAPAAYAALLAGGIGLWGAGRWAARAIPRPGWPAWSGRLLAGAILVAFFAAWANADWAMAGRQRAYQINEDGTRRALGEWLAAETPPSATVAMEAVGYQGWFSKRRIIDMAGLTSPEVVRIRRASWSNAEAFYRILKELKPDYVVLRTPEVESNRHFHGGPLFETSEHAAFFESRYREAATFKAPIPEIWGDTASITVYARAGGPDPSGAR